MRAILPAVVLLFALNGCATTPTPQTDAGIPPDAVAAERIMDNGDTITEYRVAGQLRMVQVKPKHGPAYFLYDRNGDGRIDHDRNAPTVYFELFKW
jgi:hypothetical protein